MRTIASTSGAHVTGITINDYQVSRGVYHNTRVRLLYSLNERLWEYILANVYGTLIVGQADAGFQCAHLLVPRLHVCAVVLQLGLQNLCQPTQGNFLNMPFENEVFDAAYAIEATCHANKVR